MITSPWLDITTSRSVESTGLEIHLFTVSLNLVPSLLPRLKTPFPVNPDQNHLPGVGVVPYVVTSAEAHAES